jgi:hypothetical protein
MFSNKRLLIMLSLFLCMFIGSCGVNIVPIAPTHLDGNWLLVGNQSLSQYPILSTTLVVTGNAISGTSSIHFLCANQSDLGLEISVIGQVGSDGTFQLQSQDPSFYQLSISGSVPLNYTSTWTGNYTWDDSSNNDASSCTAKHNGEFTATPIRPLNGTYVGTIAGQGFTTGTQASVRILQATTPTQNLYALSGSIEIYGSTCFTSGQTDGSGSGLAGDSYLLIFNMDDGSKLMFSGWIYNPNEATLEARFSVSGGKCNQAVGTGLFGATLPNVKNNMLMRRETGKE